METATQKISRATLSEEERVEMERQRKERGKISDKLYYERNKQKWRERYLAKKQSEEYTKAKVEHILASLTEQQRELLAKSIAPSPNTV